MHKIFPSPEDQVIAFFRKTLLEWSLAHPRPLPWKGEKDPYKIWLSEIILQQTRVEQGLPYYQKFILQYPNVRALADSPEDVLFKLWEGLGYYSRARNLHAAAKHIADQLDGKFPDSYMGIRALKGVGPYSAAAIASFAFGLPHAVLDGNVYRVLARFFGIGLQTGLPEVQKQFAVLAQKLLDPDRPAAYNQALMDFGATWCTPRQARCTDCPFNTGCVAYLTGKVAELPVKSKTLVKKHRSFFYLVVHFQGGLFVRKRTEKDIWRGLWEFPQLESAPLIAPFGAEKMNVSQPFRQLLTHQAVTAIFYEIHLPDEAAADVLRHPVLVDCERISLKNLKKNIAFPKVIDCFLQNKVLTLD